VGQSYPPEFYSFIKNSAVRSVMERIALETEEDYQALIKLLNSFGVSVLRPNIGNTIEAFYDGKKYLTPPMCPRDYMSMVGKEFHFTSGGYQHCYTDILQQIVDQGNPIFYESGVNGAATTRIGKDLYFGTTLGTTITDVHQSEKYYSSLFPTYRTHVIDTQGHSDSTFCPVAPGLIISLHDIPTYADTFPDWEVVYLPAQSWAAIPEFQKLKEKNRGKWWVPGEELNDDFTNYIESWMGHWVGYVEETVFDVNMLIVDNHNVICNNYNKQVFDAFARHNIHPHVLNFRHRYFWDGGLHCITSDLHRSSTLIDYFPERR
jgi:N-dimethylarginine dimethylaminohydrolase